MPSQAVCNVRLLTENPSKIVRDQRAMSVLHIYQTGLNVIISAFFNLQQHTFSEIFRFALARWYVEKVSLRKLFIFFDTFRIKILWSDTVVST
jgi:hypothetical protein